MDQTKEMRLVPASEAVTPDVLTVFAANAIEAAARRVAKAFYVTQSSIREQLTKDGTPLPEGLFENGIAALLKEGRLAPKDDINDVDYPDDALSIPYFVGDSRVRIAQQLSHFLAGAAIFLSGADRCIGANKESVFAYSGLRELFRDWSGYAEGLDDGCYKMAKAQLASVDDYSTYSYRAHLGALSALIEAIDEYFSDAGPNAVEMAMKISDGGEFR